MAWLLPLTALLALPMQAQTPAGICDRTPQVRDGILGWIGSVTACGDVTNTQLAAINGSLDLTDQGLTSLKMGDFNGLTHLQALDLKTNALTALPEGVFHGLTNLQNLDLQTNALTALPEDVFHGLTNLFGLSIRNNVLTAVPEDVFRGLTNLQNLSINANALTALPEGVFRGLTNLQTLDLDDNALTALPEDVFRGLTNLQTLDLSYNFLTALPEGLLDQLEGPIPAGLVRLSNLGHLLLDHNQLTGPIPAGLGQLAQLKWLTLRGNRLTGPIPAELGQLSQLQTFSLAGNQLTGPIPTRLGQLDQLKRLDLQHNQLTGEIPVELSQMSSLVSVLLNHNQLMGEIPAELSQLSNLGRLSLDHNQLTGSIPTGLGQLDQLKWLTLDRNQLTGEIPADLSQLDQLKWLHLQHNQLTGLIPTELGQLSQLEEFSFRSNRLLGLTPKELRHLPDVYVRNLNAVWVGPVGLDQIKATWDDPGDPTVSYVYSLRTKPGTSYSRLKLDALGITLRSGEGVTIEWTLTGLAASDIEVEGLSVGVSNRNGSSPHAVASVEPSQVAQPSLDFAHFANGNGIISGLVFVNVATHPIRPALYFYDKRGNLIDPELVVDITGDLKVTQEGVLSVRTEIEPLGELTISTHGRGVVVSGSVKVVSGGPIGGVLRFDLPGVGTAGVGPSPPVRDALFPARNQAGGISTAAAIHNTGKEAMRVTCRLMKDGAVLEEVEIHLEANGQEAQYIEEMFTNADTSDFVGSVRCTALPGEAMFTGVAVELDAGNRIFTTLPVVPVDPAIGGGRETVLDFAHFANGAGIGSDLVFVNVSTQPSGPGLTPYHSNILPSRPLLYFYDREGYLIDPESVVDVTGDMEVTEDGALSVRTEIEPLGELTISTHGREEVVSGSVQVVSDRPIGGVLRFDLPGIGVAGVGASQPTRDAIFPARRQAGGISTAAAIHNPGKEALEVSCRLMKAGSVLEEADIHLEANGQKARYIEELFPRTDTSDFVGSVRCMAPSEGEGMFTGVAVELDASNQIFTTLPVVPVTERMDRE